MKILKKIRRNDDGAAVIELAFGLPIFIALLWMIVQLGLVFRAMSGIQHALGQGARAATLWPVPSDDTITDAMEAAVYGVGPGHFDITPPVEGTADGSDYVDLQVTYTQDTDLLVLPGPTISVTRSKRVWVSETDD
jgi:Flp pilus assembly protein TadG